MLMYVEETYLLIGYAMCDTIRVELYNVSSKVKKIFLGQKEQ